MMGKMTLDTIAWRGMVTLGLGATLVLVAYLAVALTSSARLEATATTTWPGSWAGRDTNDGVTTHLYFGQDRAVWSERHRALVLTEIEGRP